MKFACSYCNESVKTGGYRASASTVGVVLGAVDALLIVVVLVVVLLLLAGGSWLLVARVRRSRRRLTGPKLRNRALEESERLAGLVEQREAGRPADDPVIRDHELIDRRVTFHDEETQEVYRRDHLPEVAELRELFAEHGIRNGTFDEFYEVPENDAGLRTISTALQEMAGRLG